MANKERNKRSARKARSEERARLEAAQATAESGSSGSSAKVAQAKASKPQQKKNTGFFARVRNYLHDVRVELHRVIWPSKAELKSYSIAVLVTLAIFGLVIWVVDTGIVGVLVGLTGLRG